MCEEGYGITVAVAGHAQADQVVDDYGTAVAVLKDLLRALPATTSGSCEIVDLVDERVIVHDKGTVAELLTWVSGARRG